jgi:hypothetical protein
MDKTFTWEIRVLYLVPIGMALFFINEAATYTFIAVITVGVLITDGLFSVIVAKAFLRPILQALRSKGPNASLTFRRRSGAAKRIERTKWATFAGVTLAVASSSVLYLNVILWAVMRGVFAPSPWLNPIVFMVNVDSVLNNFSLLLVSGLLRPVSSRKINNVRSFVTVKGPPEFSDNVDVARSQLETASLIPNITFGFHPPQTQARCLLLKKVAATLQAELFRSPDDAEDTGALDKGIAAVIDLEFVTTARAFFLECVEEGRQLVPQMRATYHKVRYGHLTVYLDALKVVRTEPIFPELQKESEHLVRECAKLDRPRKQSSTTVSGLCASGHAVSKRYERLMASIAQRTGATFCKAPVKGLVRMVEKLALTAGDKNWKPELLCDIVRGALEFENFGTMIGMVRLLRELDPEIGTAGVTGGITDRICICRAKNRFGQPTSGGWADFMVNFYFKDDGHKHICEVQLVHAQMLLVRTEMGAHKTYGQFRGAKEILEMLGLDPEEAADAKTRALLEELRWAGQPTQREIASCESSSVAPGSTMELETLQNQVQILISQHRRMEARVDAQAATLNAQAATLEALKEQNALLLANMKEVKEGGLVFETKTNSGGGRLPEVAAPQRNVADTNVKRRVAKMPGIDRNLESLNGNYTARKNAE